MKNLKVGKDSKGLYTIYVDDNGWTYPITLKYHKNMDALKDYMTEYIEKDINRIYPDSKR